MKSLKVVNHSPFQILKRTYQRMSMRKHGLSEPYLVRNTLVFLKPVGSCHTLCKGKFIFIVACKNNSLIFSFILFPITNYVITTQNRNNSGNVVSHIYYYYWSFNQLNFDSENNGIKYYIASWSLKI